MSKTVVVDPVENLPFRATLSGDTIATAAWSITPTGPTISAVTPVSPDHADAFVSGVQSGTQYELVCLVTASGGAILKAVWTLKGVTK